MERSWFSVVSVLAISSFLSWVQGISPITAIGSKFYDNNGDQFYVRGVVYQVEFEMDPLANPEQCRLDAALMKTLGVNTIRVYQVEYQRDHDDCMSTFADAGIYLFLGLETSQTGFDRLNPDWTRAMFDNYTAVLDAFASYDNLLAVEVANELIQDGETSVAAPYVKAAIRDLKAYRDGQGYRPIPVGYVSADVESLRLKIQNYMICGSNISNHADYFAFNRYSWCGKSSFTVSGYSDLYDDSENYPVPLFFAETGCNEIGNRTFDDQIAILGSDMNDRFSGAIIYEWKEEENNYGIVSYAFGISLDSFTGVGTSPAFTPTPISPDFYSLQSQWDTLTPTGTPSTDYTPTYSEHSCPSSSDGWDVTPAAPLPTIQNLVITTKSTASASKSGDTITPPVVVAAATTTTTGAVSPSATSSKMNSSGLSTGPKIAIGVIVPVILIAAAGIGFFFWRRNRKAKATAAKSKSSEVTQNGGQGVTEFYKPPGEESEIGGNPVSQLHAEDARQEAGGEMVHQIGDNENMPMAELDGRSRPQELSSGLSVRRPSRDER